MEGMNTTDSPWSAADRRFIDRLKVTGSSSWLLLALIVLLILLPFDDKSIAWQLTLGTLNSAILVAAAVAASRSRRTLYLALALMLPVLVLQWTFDATDDRNAGLTFVASLTLFYIFAFGHMLAYVLRPGPVTGNKIHAAIAAYIMLGLLWSFVYTLINMTVPQSFDYMGQPEIWTQGDDWRRFLFFSFVTLTTTGYGDMIPMSGHAQSAAMLEQLSGTFYVAILIARLAGLYQPGASRQPGARSSGEGSSDTHPGGRD